MQKINCDIPDQKIEFAGDYDKFECGVRLHNLEIRDRGNWQCEVEKYYVGKEDLQLIIGNFELQPNCILLFSVAAQ